MKTDKFKSQNLPSKNGFSLVEVLIALAIMGAGSVAFMSMYKNQLKSQKGIDLKNQSQSIASLFRMSMNTQNGCQKAFNVGAVPSGSTVVPPVFTGLPTLSSVATNADIEITSVDINNKIYAKDTIDGNLKVKGIFLEFSKPVSANQYIATLRLELTKLDGAMATYGAAVITERFPISISVAPPLSDGSSKLQDCFMASNQDYKLTCDGLGGRWLEGPYMPISRCNLSAAIELGMNESPDGIERDGSANPTTGERVEICYYQQTGYISVSEYHCSSRNGKVSGWRCAYDETLQQWQVRNYDAQGLRTPKKYATCTKGVRVTQQSPDIQYLDLTEEKIGTKRADELNTAFETTGSDPFIEQDRLGTVTRCNSSPLGDKWSPCNNSTNLEAAQHGDAGSCIYARGIKLQFPPGWSLTPFSNYVSDNALTITKDNYTGWIKIWQSGNNRYLSNPKIPASAPTVTPLIREARGIPCYSVEVNTGTEVNPGLTLQTDPPSDAQFNDPKLISKCVYQAKASESLSFGGGYVASAPATRQTIMDCNNTFDPGEVKEWVGIGGGTPTMLTGSCWHFVNVKINPYHIGSTGVSNKTTDTTAPDALAMTPATKYTGWVYLKANLPDGRFDRAATTGIYKNSIDYSGGDLALNGIPCNVGVRVMTPP